jgi:isopenicillin N synthase-like dioxygenase
MSIPVINFAAFYNGTKQERANLADRLTTVLKKHGAMELIDHSVTA